MSGDSGKTTIINQLTHINGFLPSLFDETKQRIIQVSDIRNDTP